MGSASRYQQVRSASPDAYRRPRDTFGPDEARISAQGEVGASWEFSMERNRLSMVPFLVPTFSFNQFWKVLERFIVRKADHLGEMKRNLVDANHL